MERVGQEVKTAARGQSPKGRPRETQIDGRCLLAERERERVGNGVGGVSIMQLTDLFIEPTASTKLSASVFLEKKSSLVWARPLVVHPAPSFFGISFSRGPTAASSGCRRSSGDAGAISHSDRLRPTQGCPQVSTLIVSGQSCSAPPPPPLLLLRLGCQ